MEKVLLHDLPARKDLIGKRINVVSQGGEFHYDYQDKPFMRIFTGAKIKTLHGKKFIEWYWEPESINGKTDCGWSGIGLENHNKFNRWLEA